MQQDVNNLFWALGILGCISISLMIWIYILLNRFKNLKIQHAGELEKRDIQIADLKSLLKATKKLLEKKEAVLTVRTEQAFLSPVSGLPNLMGSQARIDDMFARFERGRIEKITVVAIDLYRFKPVNDLYGHKNGNKVLKIAGEILLHITRPEDIVIDPHGDEFIIICADTEIDEIEAILARANTALSEYDFTFAKEGRVDTRYSFALTESNKYLNTFEKLYKIADLKCMKVKKSKGKSR